MEEVPQTAGEYVSTLQEQLERIHGFARGHLQIMTDPMKPKVVHRNFLCSYSGANNPTWFRAQSRQRALGVHSLVPTLVLRQTLQLIAKQLAKEDPYEEADTLGNLPTTMEPPNWSLSQWLRRGECSKFNCASD